MAGVWKSLERQKQVSKREQSLPTRLKKLRIEIREYEDIDYEIISQIVRQKYGLGDKLEDVEDRNATMLKEKQKKIVEKVK